MGLDSESSEPERAVVRACIEEAFWRRSLPSAIGTMAAVSWHLKRCLMSDSRALTPQRKSFRRPVPPSKAMAGTVVVGASSLAYFLGKLSYILGDNCMEKFIKEVLVGSDLKAQVKCEFFRHRKVKSHWEC